MYKWHNAGRIIIISNKYVTTKIVRTNKFWLFWPLNYFKSERGPKKTFFFVKIFLFLVINFHDKMMIKSAQKWFIIWK